MSGSVAFYHLELYNVYPHLSLALLAVKREFYKDSVLIYLRASSAAAHRAANPSGTIILLGIHLYHS